jgi:hypothetical protein
MSSIFWYTTCNQNNNHGFYTIHTLLFRILYLGDGKGFGAIPAYIHIQAWFFRPKWEGRSPVTYTVPVATYFYWKTMQLVG